MGVLELTRALIERPSVTPDDAGCQQLIADQLRPFGFEAEWFQFGEVSNLLLTRGEGKPSLWFLGHTDVVPPGPETAWHTPPFAAVERDGLLYGRGAADMKGAVAAMVNALQRVSEENSPEKGQLGLLLTSDEEGIAVDGIAQVAALIQQRGSVPDHCLVGEPSSAERLGDTVRIGRRGSIHATLKLQGVQGHTAYPQTLKNPVHELAPFLDALVSAHWDEGNELFPPTHCQVSNLQAGSGAENVTPGTLLIKFNFRNSPASPEQDLYQRVQKMLRRCGLADAELDWRVSAVPFQSPAGVLREAVVHSISEVLEETPELNTGGGTSDGRFIAPLGCEVIELGLLNHSIHQANEHVAVEDLSRLAETYRSIANHLLSS